MSKFFCEDSPLHFLEQQMQQPPGYRPMGQGIHILNQIDRKAHCSYEELVDVVITRMQMENLKNRIDEIFSGGEKEIIFLNRKHRRDFYSLMMGKRGLSLLHAPNYAGAVFLLSADEELWMKVSKHVLDTGIYFDRIRIGRVTLEQYILFHAAKDVYAGKKHIRVSELVDKELIPNRMLRLIVNAFVINKCGLKIMEWEGK